MRVVRVFLLLLVPISIFRTSLAQEQTSVLSQEENGRQLFLSNCAICHGPGGDSIYGVDLGRGKFKTVSSDEDLIRVLYAGVPGTSMPSFSKEFSQAEVRTIV